MEWNSQTRSACLRSEQVSIPTSLTNHPDGPGTEGFLRMWDFSAKTGTASDKSGWLVTLTSNLTSMGLSSMVTKEIQKDQFESNAWPQMLLKWRSIVRNIPQLLCPSHASTFQAYKLAALPARLPACLTVFHDTGQTWGKGPPRIF